MVWIGTSGYDMPNKNYFNLGGINTKVSPMIATDGQVTRCVNLYTDQVGAKRKRCGYTTFLDNPNPGSPVRNLIQYRVEGGTISDGTANFIYRIQGGFGTTYSNEGGTAYYYDAFNGTTSSWINVGNGTFSYNHAYGTVFNDVFIVAGGTPKYTTSESSGFGKSFTDMSGAPAQGRYVASEFGRVFIGDYGNNLYWSSANDGTNWSGSGTSDSSSIIIPGMGRMSQVISVNDRIVVPKTTGAAHRWDDYSLRSIPTVHAYSASDSIGDVDGYKIGLNATGFYGYGGKLFEILSNPIEKQIYNEDNTGINDYQIYESAGVVHQNHYYCAVGTVTDSYTKKTVNDCVEVFNYQLNQWYNYQYANFPTAYLNYLDNSNKNQLIFGDANGQVYQVVGTATSDNGTPISCVLEGFVTLDTPERDKIFKTIIAYANPGCEAQVYLAGAYTYHPETLHWKFVGDLKPGIMEYRTGDIRGKFLFYRVIESSTTAPFIFYGFHVQADFIGD